MIAVVLFPLDVTAAIDENWYVKTRFSSDGSSKVIFTDRDCRSESPAALYGCGVGGDGLPYRSNGKIAFAPIVELGIGRQITSRLRVEVLVGRHLQRAFRGRTNFLDPKQMQTVYADLSALNLMLAVKADFSVLKMPSNVRVVPHVGLGIGAIHTKIGETNMTFPSKSTTVPGGSYSDFSWMVSTGVGIELTSRTVLELDVRYSDLGEVRTERGPGLVVWRDGSRTPLTLDLAPTLAKVSAYGLGLSLRFKL